MLRIEYTSEERAVLCGKTINTVAAEKKYLATTQEFPPEQTVEFVKSIIKHNYTQFLLIDNETVAGWCDIIPKPQIILSHCGVLGMGLLKEYRGQGWGKRLIRTAIDDAFSKKIERIELEVFESNETAISLYKKVGFTVEGKKIKAKKFNGVYDNVVLMALLREDIA